MTCFVAKFLSDLEVLIHVIPVARPNYRSRPILLEFLGHTRVER